MNDERGTPVPDGIYTLFSPARAFVIIWRFRIERRLQRLRKLFRWRFA